MHLMNIVKFQTRFDHAFLAAKAALYLGSSLTDSLTHSQTAVKAGQGRAVV